MKNMAYLPAQGGSLECAKGYFAGFYGLGSYFARRQVLEIPYRINRYDIYIYILYFNKKYKVFNGFCK